MTPFDVDNTNVTTQRLLVAHQTAYHVIDGGHEKSLSKNIEFLIKIHDFQLLQTWDGENQVPY